MLKKRQGKDIEIELITKLNEFIIAVDTEGLAIKKNNDNIEWQGEATFNEIDVVIYQHDIIRTEEYIKEHSQKLLNTSNAPEYIKACLSYIEEDEVFVRCSINPRYSEIYSKLNIKHFVQSKLSEVVKKDTGLEFMLDNKKKAELKQLYKLAILDEEAFILIRDGLSDYIKRKGTDLRESKELSKDPKVFIPKLIEMKESFDELVEVAFLNDRRLNDSQNGAFMSFMSKGDLTYKQLANYMNYEFRAGIKTDSETQVADKFNKIIKLFNNLSNKMLFIREHFKHMSDRLLKKKTLSVPYEQKFVNSLKSIVGATDVQKLTNMLQDLKTTETTMAKFKQRLTKKDLEDVDFSTIIIQSNSWHLDENVFLQLQCPRFIEGLLGKFSDFYMKMNTNLQLAFAYSKAELEVLSLKYSKKYVVAMTLPQYLIIYYLEIHGKLNGTQLKELSGIGLKQIQTEIYFLLWGAYNTKKEASGGFLLTSGKVGEEPELNDVFELNLAFENSQTRLSTLPVMLKSRKNEAEEDKKEDEERKNMRKYQNDIVDSNIVRIMKGRKDIETSHQDLVNETSNSISVFSASPFLIKERIESLIERKILSRNDKRRNFYCYIS